MPKSFFPTLISTFKEHHDAIGNKTHILVCADSITGLPQDLEPVAFGIYPANGEHFALIELNITAGSCTPIEYGEDGLRTSMRFKGEEHNLFVPYKNIALIRGFDKDFSEYYSNTQFEAPEVEQLVESEFVAPQTEADEKRAKMRLV